MAASDYTNVLQRFYIAYFGRPADPSGLAFAAAALNASGAPITTQALLNAYGNNATVRSLVDGFGNSAESLVFFSGATTSQRVASIYLNILNREADTSGLFYWTNEIDSGRLSLSKVALAIMAAAEKDTLGDAVTVARKLDVALRFTNSLNQPEEVAAYSGDAAAQVARSLLKQVDRFTDPATFQLNVDSTINQLVNRNSGVDGVNVVGTAGNDNLVAGAGPDTVSGGPGNDTLNGSFSDDTLNGGNGNDVFNVSSGSDTVEDLGNGQDTLTVQAGARVSANLFSDYTATASNSNAGTATLTSSGKNVDVSAAFGPNGYTIVNTGVAAAFTGSGFADTLQGGTGNDTLNGGGGDDRLQGGEGADALDGGAGNDTLTGGAAGDTFTVGLGTDDITDLGVGTTADALVVAAGAVANATLGGAFTATTATRNAGIANLFTDGKAVNLLAAQGPNGFTVTATTANAVAVDGSLGNDTLLGNSGNDTLNGRDGIDSLVGGAGEDTLRGGASSDTLVGGLGNDSIEGGSGADMVLYNLSTDGSDDVDLGVGPGDVVVLSAQNTTRIRLTMDTTEVGNNDPTLTVEALVEDAGEPATNGNVALFDDEGVVFKTASDAIGFSVFDNILSPIDFVSRGSFRLVSLGTAGDDSGADTMDFSGAAYQGAPVYVHGGGGNDLLVGNTGADLLIGGLGKDTLTGGAGSDALAGGDGSDRFVFDALPNNNGADLILDFATGTGAEADVLDLRAFLGGTPADLTLVQTDNPTLISQGLLGLGGSIGLNIQNKVALLVDRAGGQSLTNAAGLNAALGNGGEYSNVDMTANSRAIIITASSKDLGNQYVYAATSDAGRVITTTLVGILKDVDIDGFTLNNFA